LISAENSSAEKSDRKYELENAASTIDKHSRESLWLPSMLVSVLIIRAYR